MLDKLKYRKPNFNREWLEAVRYPEFQEIGRQGWLDIAPKGHVMNYSDIKDSLGNVDLNFDSLERDKKIRFIESYKKGVVEIPIAVSFGGEYDLLGGNTRLAGLVKLGHDPKIWVVGVPETIMEKWTKKYKDSIDCSNPKGFSQRAHCQGKSVKENENLKGGLSDNMSLGDIAHKHKIDIELLTKQFLLGVKKEMEHTNDKREASEIAMDHLYEDPKYYVKLKKVETKEMTGADSSGSYNGPMSISLQKKDISKIHNWGGLEEALEASSSGEYDVPFLGTTSKGRNNPLGIEGPESIKKSRAVKDKKFPKWGGPGGIFIKIKEKCKKFPYCNQGDINAIEILRESITSISKEMGIPRSEIEKIVLNEINKIFI